MVLDPSPPPLVAALCMRSKLTRGWLRLVGSIKLHVSCAKEPYKRDAILPKRPIILSILLTVASAVHMVHMMRGMHIKPVTAIRTYIKLVVAFSSMILSIMYVHGWWRLCVHTQYVQNISIMALCVQVSGYAVCLHVQSGQDP